MGRTLAKCFLVTTNSKHELEVEKITEFQDFFDFGLRLFVQSKRKGILNRKSLVKNISAP